MKKILVAEDDKFLANAYRLKLEKSGYEVILTYDGEETLAKINEETPDLLLLDLLMPKTDGYKVLDEIKKIEKEREIPIIVVTNLGQEEDYERVKKYGVVEYIVKTDITLDDLVMKIEKFLS